MPVMLDPVTREKIDRFGRRRKRFLMIRGLSDGLLALLLGMTAVALVDWQVMLPDAVRLALSLTVYAAVLAVLLFVCVIPLLRLPDRKQLARLFETLRPELREDLLSAVELGSDTTDGHRDSELFRKLLQASVADRIRNEQINVLLPSRLIRFPLVLAFLLTVVFLTLCFVSSLDFGMLAFRAFFPVANTARVSETKISIVKPEPAEKMVPRGDPLEVLVELSGPQADEVLLELFREGKESTTFPMKKRGEMRRYAVELSTASERFRYRIRARDALTKKCLITTHLRPYVTMFDKTFMFPAYSELPAKKVRNERRGDLSALAGTTASLVMKTDQKIEHASFEIEQEGKIEHLPVAIADDGTTVRGEIPIRVDGEYKVHLKAAETGFENGRFSPRYSIKAIQDRIPIIRMDAPAGELLLGAEEVVDVTGKATDDIGISAVSQCVQVNDEAVVETVVADRKTIDASGRREQDLAFAWDLFPLELEHGDRIEMTLKVTDFQGNTAKSAPVRITVASEGYESQNVSLLKKKRKIYEVLALAMQQVEDLNAQFRDASKRFSGMDRAKRSALFEGLDRNAEELGRRLESGFEAVKEAYSETESDCDSFLISFSGRIMRKSHEMWVNRLSAVAQEAYRDEEEASFALKYVEDALNGFHSFLKKTAAPVRELLVSDEVASIYREFFELQRNQDRADSLFEREPLPPDVFKRWSLREQTTVKQMASLIGQVSEYSERYHNRMYTIQKVVRAEKTVRELLAEGSNAADLQKEANKISVAIQSDLKHWLNMHKGNSEKRKWLLRHYSENVGRASESIAGVGALFRSLQWIRKTDPAPWESRAVERAWKTAAGLCSAYAEVEEGRSFADTRFVKDLDLSYRAVKALHLFSGEQENRETALKGIETVSAALKKLEAGHGLCELTRQLKEMAVSERWHFESPDMFLKAPPRWTFMYTRKLDLINLFRRVRFPNEAVEKLSEMRNGAAAKEIDRQMALRLATRRQAIKRTQMHASFEELAEMSLEVEALIEEELEKARLAIAAYVPTLAEQLRQAADKAREAEEKIRDALAEQSETESETDEENAAPELEEEILTELLPLQDQVTERVDDLTETLARDANLQDVLTEEGLERARDADNASAMMREPAYQAQESLNQSALAEDPAVQQGNLQEAADQNRELADTMEKLADHFEKLDQGLDVADSRAELRSSEEAFPLQSELESEFDQAGELQDLASMTAEEMLRALEEELGINSEMQRELGVIGDDTLNQAVRDLERAADSEDNIADRIRNGSQEAAGAFSDAAEALAEIGKQAQAEADKRMPAMRQQAQAQNGQAEVGEQIARAENKANEAAATAESAASPRGGEPDSLSEFAQKAREVAEALGDAENAMQTVRDNAQGDSSDQSAQLADQAEGAEQRFGELSDAAREIAEQAEAQLEAAGRQQRMLSRRQDAVEPVVDGAGEQVARAARHEERLGNEERSQALENSAAGIEGVSENELPEAASALQEPGTTGEAAGPVEAARDAIGEQAENLAALQQAEGEAQAAGSEPMAPAAQPGSEDIPAAMSQALAHALDQLDQLVSGQEAMESQAGAQDQAMQAAQQGSQAQQGRPEPGQQGQPGEQVQPGQTGQQAQAGQPGRQGQPGQEGQPGQQGQPGQSGQQGQPAQGATPSQLAYNRALLQRAAALQSESLRQARARSANAQTPGRVMSSEGLTQSESQGASVEGAPLAYKKLFESAAEIDTTIEWGKLPPKMAKDLMEARREKVAEKYRHMVEIYFKSIAEKGRRKK